jgi:pimeloyl-ACP methyl ester carboxylesterase
MMTLIPISGLLGNRVPFVRFGQGKERLVIFPGINDAFLPAGSTPLYTAWFFRSYGNHFTVYVMGRRRPLPQGYTTGEMAVDYASAIEEIGGPVHILGLSMGSLIAQHLAVEFPRHVQRLILALAGARGSPETIERIQQWVYSAQRGNWQELYINLIDATFRGWRRILWRNVVNLFAYPPLIPSDVIVSAQASKHHDALKRLHEITAPTLVLGGTKDKLFPEALFRELADSIPYSSLQLIRGLGHGVFIERKKAFDRLAIDFLNSEEIL